MDSTTVAPLVGAECSAVPEAAVSRKQDDSEDLAAPSKRGAKRLARLTHLAEMKPIWRKAQKLKKKLRKAEGSVVWPKPKLYRMADSSRKLTVAIDCSFDAQMSEKDCRMLLKQLCSSYGVNRRSPNPLQLHITSLEGKLGRFYHETQGTAGWDVHVHSNSYLETFAKDRLVYLSSDSPNSLDSLNPDENKVLVIGGLVDHNHHKGLCHRKAVESGVSHARLPLERYVDLKTRKVLTVNQVFQILLRYLDNGGSWAEAIMEVLPSRKGAVLLPEETPTDHQSASS